MVLEAWGGIADDILDIMFRFFVPLYSLFRPHYCPYSSSVAILCLSLPFPTLSLPFPFHSALFLRRSAHFGALWSALCTKGMGGRIAMATGVDSEQPRFSAQLRNAFSPQSPHRFPRNLEETTAPLARTFPQSYRAISARTAENERKTSQNGALLVFF